MKKEKLEAHIKWLENLLKDFQEIKSRGKETNSNDERARSIKEIEEVTERLEMYMQNNEDLMEIIAGTNVEIAREIEWNEIVRPDHFEEDLQEEINKLKEVRNQK